MSLVTKMNTQESALQHKTIVKKNEDLIPAFDMLLKEGHTVTFVVKGYSMRPFLEHLRDEAKLESPAGKKIKCGDVVLAEVLPRTYVLHRVESIVDGIFTLRGDGNVYGREQCREGDIIAIATEFYRKGRKRPDKTTGLKWRAYSALWPSSSLLRRIILGLQRRLWIPLFRKKDNNTSSK